MRRIDTGNICDDGGASDSVPVLHNHHVVNTRCAADCVFDLSGLDAMAFDADWAS